MKSSVDLKRKARIAGLLYLTLAITSIFGLMANRL